MLWSLSRNMALFSLDNSSRSSFKVITTEFINIYIWMFINAANNNISFLRIANLNKCRFLFKGFIDI